LLFVGVSIWLYRDAILRTRLGSYQAPLGYAFVIAAAGAAALNLMLSFEPSFRWDEHRVYVAPLGLTGAVVLIGLFMLLAVRRQQQASPVSSKVAVIVVAVSAALAALTASAPEVSVALVLIALGHARRETGIYALGIALLGIALFALYHHVHTTLLWKSVWVTATGALLLVGWWTLTRAFGDLGRRSGETPVDKGLSFAASVAVPGIAVVDRRLAQLFVGPRPVGAVAIALLFGLGVPFGLAAHKEDLKRGGERVLLELAPSDPRSIMQGDYMTLTYAIENELRDRILDPQLDDEVDPMPIDGTVTLVLDDRGVARIARASDANDAGARVRLRYRVRGNWHELVHVAPSTFFFAEGSAASYASARYGEVAISGDGEAVLVGLRDANLNRL